jgi:hypothetical protein
MIKLDAELIRFLCLNVLQALSALGYVTIEGVPATRGPETEHLQHLATCIDISEPLLVCALGALVASLVKVGHATVELCKSTGV